MKRAEHEDWVEVASTGQDEEAALIAGLLQSEDIPAVVEGPSPTFPLPENLGAFGMSRVLVPPERAAEARELIGRREREFREHPAESSESSDEE
jgi:hypothetical protein